MLHCYTVCKCHPSDNSWLHRVGNSFLDGENFSGEFRSDRVTNFPFFKKFMLLSYWNPVHVAVP